MPQPSQSPVKKQRCTLALRVCEESGEKTECWGKVPSFLRYRGREVYTFGCADRLRKYTRPTPPAIPATLSISFFSNWYRRSTTAGIAFVCRRLHTQLGGDSAAAPPERPQPPRVPRTIRENRAPLHRVRPISNAHCCHVLCPPPRLSSLQLRLQPRRR